ncbi:MULTISPECIES: hypothetical protein [Kribbella]|nr:MULTISPECIES: hypothetical protein [Kribbella]
MTGDDLNTVVDRLVQALNTRVVGFDGVEVHAANGYLLDSAT